MGIDSSILTDISSLDTSEMEGKYLTFWTDKQLFGIPIADVVQIVGMQEITEVPEYPAYAKGVINQRGSIIPIIDIRLRFGKPEKEYDDRTCIIITNIGGVLIGFIVDNVNEVSTIEDDEISMPPKISSGGENAYITGIGKKDDQVILLLDTQKILNGEQLEQLSAQE